MEKDKNNPKLRGALLTFIILQLCYLFFFFIRFPDSFRNVVGEHYGALDMIASWLSSITMLGYCITCLISIVQLVMRKHGFLRWFQISGAIALVGNFIVYIMRQVAGGIYQGYSFYAGDYYWMLFIAALFWTVVWYMYFVRSSRVFSYMGEDGTYIRQAFFTKNTKDPAPWEEARPVYPVYPQPSPVILPQNQPPVYTAPGQHPGATPPNAPPQQARPMQQQPWPAYPQYYAQQPGQPLANQQAGVQDQGNAAGMDAAQNKSE